MSERPGPDIGVPKQQHQLVAMLYLVSCSQSKEEAHGFLAALEAAVEELWGWEPDRLRVELVEVRQVLQDYQGKTTFWFTPAGTLEFDYNCTPPK